MGHRPSEARDALAALVGAGRVWLVAGSPDDRDQYDRLLRYLDVDAVGGRIDAAAPDLCPDMRDR